MRFSEETFIFGGIVLSCVAVILVGLGFDYLNAQQVRVMYQTAYTKNMECRTTSSKGTAVYNLEKVCGPVPNFEDYRNK